MLNTENGYEYMRGHPTEKKQVHHTDKVRRSAWRIVCAGGYFAAGFHGTDTFTYKANDGHADSNAATVTIWRVRESSTGLW